MAVTFSQDSRAELSKGCRMPVPVMIIWMRMQQEEETGLCGFPGGYPFPSEGELAVATLLQLPAGNQAGDMLRPFRVEET